MVSRPSIKVRYDVYLGVCRVVSAYVGGEEAILGRGQKLWGDMTANFRFRSIYPSFNPFFLGTASPKGWQHVNLLPFLFIPSN